MEREIMDYDLVIVGAGPAGLSCAIRLKQLCQEAQRDLSICILEKGASVGAHILSGAVFEPRALNELIPQWQELGAPLKTPALQDHFLYLTKNHSLKLPTPKPMKNHGNFIISLADLCRWLAEQAESLGVEIYPGFAAVDLILDEQGHVNGVITGDKGIDKHGQPTENYQAGIGIRAKQTVIAEGCRGSIAKQVISRFELDKNNCPQTYGLGIKELWKIPEANHQAGTVIHTIGWPLDQKTYGGSFLYHFDKDLISIGFVVGLDYQNPYLNPYEEFQRFKTHPSIIKILEGGQRIAYGARALVEGGLQSLPTLNFPGGLLIGDSAGFLNTPKIKGSHTAMKSGMIAAETLFANLSQGSSVDYRAALKKTWVWDELYRARNIRPAFRWGLWPALAYAALDTYIFQGHAPWTLKNHADYNSLIPAAKARKITYDKHDGKITFDLMDSVYLSNTHHTENQPCHLRLNDSQLAIDINYQQYDSPEQRYCPAGVYEIVYTLNEGARLQINSQNCVHCKTCDIKDPKQNITWIPPEGGGGPNYSSM
jgi:electron-transferring-flavoprotein dehydrogenase